jgi:hypothetical protein
MVTDGPVCGPLSIYHLNQTQHGDTKPSVRRDESRMGNVTFEWEIQK